jgi:hypothetical protein
MALDLRRADDRLRAAVPAVARIVPVGEAFSCAIARGIADPDPYDGIAPGEIDLWASDHYHASNAGYYLEALTVFAAVTSADPRVLGRNEKAARDLKIAPATARKLQQVAYAVARNRHCGRPAPQIGLWRTRQDGWNGGYDRYYWFKVVHGSPLASVRTVQRNGVGK